MRHAETGLHVGGEYSWLPYAGYNRAYKVTVRKISTTNVEDHYNAFGAIFEMEKQLAELGNVYSRVLFDASSQQTTMSSLPTMMVEMLCVQRDKCEIGAIEEIVYAVKPYVEPLGYEIDARHSRKKKNPIVELKMKTKHSQIEDARKEVKDLAAICETALQNLPYKVTFNNNYRWRDYDPSIAPYFRFMIILNANPNDA